MHNGVHVPTTGGFHLPGSRHHTARARRCGSRSRTVLTIIPAAHQNSLRQSQQQPNRLIEAVEETEGFARKIEDAERRIPFSKTPYAAIWKSSICRIQLVSGFHLGQIWATILRSRELTPKRELRLGDRKSTRLNSSH